MNELELLGVQVFALLGWVVDSALCEKVLLPQEEGVLARIPASSAQLVRHPAIQVEQRFQKTFERNFRLFQFLPEYLVV